MIFYHLKPADSIKKIAYRISFVPRKEKHFPPPPYSPDFSHCDFFSCNTLSSGRVKNVTECILMLMLRVNKLNVDAVHQRRRQMM
jgi:hypothetical protein